MPRPPLRRSCVLRSRPQQLSLSRLQRPREAPAQLLTPSWIEVRLSHGRGLGWPAMIGSLALGGLWAYRRFRSRLPKTGINLLPSKGQDRPRTDSPIEESSRGPRGLPSGSLLLALMAFMSFGLSALYDYPSQLTGLQPWIGALPWVWYMCGTFGVGLLSDSRGVGAIPILGHFMGLLVWHSTPGESIDALTYDLGLLGFLLGPVVVISVVMYLPYRLGRALRRTAFGL